LQEGSYPKRPKPQGDEEEDVGQRWVPQRGEGRRNQKTCQRVRLDQNIFRTDDRFKY
jgi:hypothetical protein